MRICIITDNKSSYASRRFAKEARLTGNKLSFFSWDEVCFDSDGKGLLFGAKVPLEKFDAVILRSSHSSLTPLSLIVEECGRKGIRLLNQAFYLRHQSINKIRQQMIFYTENIPCLRTLYGEDLSYNFLKRKLGSPFVAKIANGSLGKNIYKISSQKDFLMFSKKIRTRGLFVFQKFYAVEADYRVFVINGKAFGPMKRIAKKGEWRTNIPGASHERSEKKESLLKFAKSVAKKINIDFAGIDILIDSYGQPRIIEINTMASFKLFDKIYPEANIAGKTIGFLISKKACLK